MDYGRVYISVKNKIAERTLVDTNRQRLRNKITTTRAFLTAVSGVDFNYCSTSLFRFVGQKIKEHTPRRISYASGECQYVIIRNAQVGISPKK